MADVMPDSRFEREGRGLGAWLLELLSPDRAVRRAAENAVSAMFHGVATADTEIKVGTLPADISGHREAFYAEVRRVVNGPGFPAAEFVRGAIAQMREARRENRARVKLESRVWDRWMNDPDADPTSDPPGLGEWKTKLAEDAVGKARLSFGDQALPLVFKHIGLAVLAAPKQVRGALSVSRRSVEWSVAEAVEGAGPAAVGFADVLLARLDRATEREGFDMAGVLAAIGAGSEAVAGELVRRLRTGSEWVKVGAAATIERIGGAGLGRWREGALQLLLDAVRVGPDAGATAKPLHWVALSAMASVGRDRREVLDIVLELARPRPPRWRTVEGHAEYRYDEVMAERGTAIEALRYMTAFPADVVLVLADAIETFEEYDPDWSYERAEHGRVVASLRAFGAAAATAVPVLARHVKRSDHGGWDSEVIRLLGEIGPAAREALPALEALWRESGDESMGTPGEGDDAEQVDPLGWTIRRIRTGG